MRDAFGGVFMIRLMLVFIFIYVAFTAISLNYAKAFRVKNKVIDFVEQEEITNLNSFFSAANGKELAKLDKILDSANYKFVCTNGNGKLAREAGEPQAYCYHGIVLEQSTVDKNAIYYNVYTYADRSLKALNKILLLGGERENSRGYVEGTWEISGEAKVVKRK